MAFVNTKPQRTVGSMHISLIADHNITWYKPELLKQMQAEQIGGAVTLTLPAKTEARVGISLYQYDPNLHILTSKAYESDLIFIYISDPKRFNIENIKTLADKTKGYVIVNNIVRSSFHYSPHGCALNYEFPPFDRSNIIEFDLQSFYQKYGAKQIEHTALRYVNDMIFTPEYLTKLIYDYLGYVKAYLGLSKKCIILDLDNTLYEGVVGENTMRLDKTPRCAQYIHLQKTLLDLYKKGIVLAVCSKNNYDDAIKALQHPNMLIREEHLACIKANWKPKVDNVLAIAKEINLTTDSFVFIDDNIREIEEVKIRLPEVFTIQATPNVVDTINDLNCFTQLHTTNTDGARGRLYAENRKRRELEKTVTHEEYITSLNQKVTYELLSKETIPRVTQLINRTNQFNLATIRRTEKQVTDLLIDTSYKVLTVSVKDRYGSSGIVGVIIICNKQLETFLLSCRTLGRGIEDLMLQYIEKEINNIVYIPTHKNKQCKAFLKKHNYIQVEGDGYAKVK